MLGILRVPTHHLEKTIVFYPSTNFSHLCSLAGALRVVPFTRCAVVRERGLSSGSVGLARWLFGDSNTVVSSRWGLGGLRHFSGALRPFRHSSRGLPSGSAIWCPSSLRCAGAHYSGFVGRASSKWLLGEYGIFLFCSPRFWVVGFFFARAFLLGRLIIV